MLPIKRAEELLGTLPGVIAARIIASESGTVDEIHVLTSADVPPKQTVRNIESALIAHLGMKVDHRKISVATTAEPDAVREGRTPGAPAASPRAATPAKAAAAVVDPTPPGGQDAALRRVLLFEDIEVRRSRTKGISCRVTLSKGDENFVGEAEGAESDRSRIDLPARAALSAIAHMDLGEQALTLDGARQIDAFERQFVFVTVTARLPRSSVLLTGSCEIKDSAETASVLAVLDATNRWIAAHTK